MSSVKRLGSETTRALLLACLGWLACFSSATARAATTIAWHAPPECPNQSHLIQGVETWIGAAITEPRAQELAISGQVSADSTYAVTIEIVSNEGRSERRLEHADCARLVEAAELVIALAIDPERVKRRQRELQPPVSDLTAKPTAQAPPPASTTPHEGTGLPGPASPRAARNERDTASASRDSGPWLLSASGLVGGGMLPGVGAGAGLEVGFAWRMLRAGVTGSYWLSREVDVAAPRPLSLNLQLAAAGLELCGAWRFGDVRFGPCGRAELGRMTGWGTGVDDARQGHERWSAVSLHAAARYPDSARLAGRLLVGGGLSLDRPVFGVTRAGVAESVFQTHDAFWRCALGLELRL